MTKFQMFFHMCRNPLAGIEVFRSQETTTMTKFQVYLS